MERARCMIIYQNITSGGRQIDYSDVPYKPLFKRGKLGLGTIQIIFFKKRSWTTYAFRIPRLCLR